jgi:hypothetical protein
MGSAGDILILLLLAMVPLYHSSIPHHKHILLCLSQLPFFVFFILIHYQHQGLATLQSWPQSLAPISLSPPLQALFGYSIIDPNLHVLR